MNKTFIRRKKPEPEKEAPELVEEEVAPPPKPVPATPQRERKVGTLDSSSLLAELEALGEGGMASLLAGSSKPRRFEVGDMVKGKISHIENELLFVSIGAKSEATMLATDSKLETPAVGDEIEAMVIKNSHQGIKLANKLSQGGDAEALHQALDSGLSIQAKVVARNKGGYEIQAFGLRGFCPLSQISIRLPEDLDTFIGETFEFQVLSIGSREFSASRRPLLEVEAKALREKRLAELELGAKVSGVIEKVFDFGAFVDLGGISGLIPNVVLRRSEETYSAGDPVEVKISRLDRETERISLDLLMADPWAKAKERYSQGGVYKGRVVQIEEYGLFVQLSPSFVGLAHKSTFPEGKTRRSFKLEEELSVQLVEMDLANRRLKLSLRIDEAFEAPKPSAESEEAGVATLGDLLSGFKWD
jgi:small subunit ribosomal protein S1